MINYLRNILIVSVLGIAACTANAKPVYIVDSMHFSDVFGEYRHYRIFLPSEYYERPNNYPVVYFYHGWSQRYFGSLIRDENNTKNPSEEELISEVVDRYQLIVVKPDGYNADPEDPYYLRPYNVGPVETHRQFALYFPELVGFVDKNYRTKPERKYRGITGYSMGGFMSFWLAGKYPHLVSAAGSFCGSPEFVIGPKNFPVEYYHGDVHQNYKGVRLRLNYGIEDFIRAYHRDLNEIFENRLEYYEVSDYPGGHALSGFDDMFDFFNRSFESPLPLVRSWNHIDVYPHFEVWDYRVTSDRNIPGFTILENVCHNGFRSSIRPFLPNGKPMERFMVRVGTSPRYERNTDYVVAIYDLKDLNYKELTIKSDDDGRLEINLNGSLNEVAIFHPDSARALPIIHSVERKLNSQLEERRERFFVKILNKGTEDFKDAKMEIFSFRDKVKLGEVSVSKLRGGKLVEIEVEIQRLETNHTLEVEKYIAVFSNEKGKRWEDTFELRIPERKTLEKNYIIADGGEYTYLSRGSDTITAVLGTGNGDGVLNPGESFAILVEDNGLHRLTQIKSNSEFLNLESKYSRKSDNWVPFDHVGGSFKYTIPTVSSNILDGEFIDLAIEYWMPDYPDHFIKKSRIRVPVEGEDFTAPVVNDITLNGDNVLQISISDGASIEVAKLLVKGEEDTGSITEYELNDDGVGDDIVPNDGVITQKISVPYFGEYNLSLYIEDELGNSGVVTPQETYLFYGNNLK